MIKEILQKEKTDKCLEEHIFLLEQQRHLLFYSRRRFPRLCNAVVPAYCSAA